MSGAVTRGVCAVLSHIPPVTSGLLERVLGRSPITPSGTCISTGINHLGLFSLVPGKKPDSSAFKKKKRQTS